MSNSNIVDIFIENIKTDQTLLNQVNAKIEEVKEEKRIIVNRLKESHKDVSVFLRYADDTKKKELESLGFEFSESERGLNNVATKTYDIIAKAKGNQLSNYELYEAYVKTFKEKNQAVNYTEFNIKCRSLFNTQRLLRKKGTDPKSSRTDIISLNGKVLAPSSEKQGKK